MGRPISYSTKYVGRRNLMDFFLSLQNACTDTVFISYKNQEIT
jgi:hypothetical protein